MSDKLIRDFAAKIVHGKARPGDLVICEMQHAPGGTGRYDFQERLLEVHIRGFIVPGDPPTFQERVALELMEDDT